MRLQGRSMVDVPPSHARGVRLRPYLIMLLIPWWLVSQAWGQSPTPPRLSVTSSQVDVPRQLSLQAAEAQVLDTMRTQLLQLRQAFSTAVLARENVRVARENLDLTTDTERLIKTRVSAGDAPEWDLIKFQASKVQFQRDLVAAHLAYQQAVRDVLTFMGATFPPGSSVTPAAGAPP